MNEPNIYIDPDDTTAEIDRKCRAVFRELHQVDDVTSDVTMHHDSTDTPLRAHFWLAMIGIRWGLAKKDMTARCMRCNHHLNAKQFLEYCALGHVNCKGCRRVLGDDDIEYAVVEASTMN